MAYESKLEFVEYRYHQIWRLRGDTCNYPWHVYLQGHKNFDTLEEAKAAVDKYKEDCQRELEEIYKKFPRLRRFY